MNRIEEDKTKVPSGRPNEFVNRTTLVIYIDEKDVDKLKEVAGGVPLSTYVRKLILDDIDKNMSLN